MNPFLVILITSFVWIIVEEILYKKFKNINSTASVTIYLILIATSLIYLLSQNLNDIVYGISYSWLDETVLGSRLEATLSRKDTVVLISVFIFSGLYTFLNIITTTEGRKRNSWIGLIIAGSAFILASKTLIGIMLGSVLILFTDVATSLNKADSDEARHYKSKQKNSFTLIILFLIFVTSIIWFTKQNTSESLDTLGKSFQPIAFSIFTISIFSFLMLPPFMGLSVQLNKDSKNSQSTLIFCRVLLPALWIYKTGYLMNLAENGLYGFWFFVVLSLVSSIGILIGSLRVWASSRFNGGFGNIVLVLNSFLFFKWISGRQSEAALYGLMLIPICIGWEAVVRNKKIRNLKWFHAVLFLTTIGAPLFCTGTLVFNDHAQLFSSFERATELQDKIKFGITVFVRVLEKFFVFILLLRTALELLDDKQKNNVTKKEIIFTAILSIAFLSISWGLPFFAGFTDLEINLTDKLYKDFYVLVVKEVTSNNLLPGYSWIGSIILLVAIFFIFFNGKVEKIKKSRTLAEDFLSKIKCKEDDEIFVSEKIVRPALNFLISMMTNLNEKMFLGIQKSVNYLFRMILLSVGYIEEKFKNKTLTNGLSEVMGSVGNAARVLHDGGTQFLIKIGLAFFIIILIKLFILVRGQ